MPSAPRMPRIPPICAKMGERPFVPFVMVQDSAAPEDISIVRLFTMFQSSLQKYAVPRDGSLRPVYIVDRDAYIDVKNDAQATLKPCSKLEDTSELVVLSAELIDKAMKYLADEYVWADFIRETEELASEGDRDAIRNLKDPVAGQAWLRSEMLKIKENYTPLVEAVQSLFPARMTAVSNEPDKRTGFEVVRSFTTVSLASLESICAADGINDYNRDVWMTPAVVANFEEASTGVMMPQLTQPGTPVPLKTCFYGWHFGEKGGYWVCIVLTRLSVDGQSYYNPYVRALSTLDTLPELNEKVPVKAHYDAIVVGTSDASGQTKLSRAKILNTLQQYYGRSANVEIVLAETVRYEHFSSLGSQAQPDTNNVRSDGFYKKAQIDQIEQARKWNRAITLEELLPTRRITDKEREFMYYARYITHNDDGTKSASRELSARLGELNLLADEKTYVAMIVKRLDALTDALFTKFMDEMFTIWENGLRSPRQKRLDLKMIRQLRVLHQNAWGEKFISSTLRKLAPFSAMTNEERSNYVTERRRGGKLTPHISALEQYYVDHLENTRSNVLAIPVSIVPENTPVSRRRGIPPIFHPSGDNTTALPKDEQALRDNPGIAKLLSPLDVDDETEVADDEVETETIVDPKFEVAIKLAESDLVDDSKDGPKSTWGGWWDASSADDEAAKKDAREIAANAMSSEPMRFFDLGAFMFGLVKSRTIHGLLLPAAEKTFRQRLRNRSQRDTATNILQTLTILRTRFDGGAISTVRRELVAPSIFTRRTERVDYYGANCPLRQTLLPWLAGYRAELVDDPLGLFLAQSDEDADGRAEIFLSSFLAYFRLRYFDEVSIVGRFNTPNELSIGETLYLRHASAASLKSQRSVRDMRNIGNIIIGRALNRLGRSSGKPTPLQDILLAYPPGRLFEETKEGYTTFANRRPYESEVFHLEEPYDEDDIRDQPQGAPPRYSARTHFYDFSRLRSGDYFSYDLSYRQGLFNAAAQLYLGFDASESVDQMKSRAPARVAQFQDFMKLQNLYLPQILYSMRKKDWTTVYNDTRLLGASLSVGHRDASYDPTAVNYGTLTQFYATPRMFHVAPGVSQSGIVVLTLGKDGTLSDSLTAAKDGEYPFQAAEDVPLLYPNLRLFRPAEAKAAKDLLPAWLDAMWTLWLVCQTARMDAITVYGPLAVLSMTIGKWISTGPGPTNFLSQVPEPIRQLFTPGYQGAFRVMSPLPSIPEGYEFSERTNAIRHAEQFLALFTAASTGELKGLLKGRYPTPTKKIAAEDVPSRIIQIAGQSWKIDFERIVTHIKE